MTTSALLSLKVASEYVLPSTAGSEKSGAGDPMASGSGWSAARMDPFALASAPSAATMTMRRYLGIGSNLGF
jgi:hypothetical protein